MGREVVGGENRVVFCVAIGFFLTHNMWLCCIIPYGWEGLAGVTGKKQTVLYVVYVRGCERIESGLKVDQDEY